MAVQQIHAHMGVFLLRVSQADHDHDRVEMPLQLSQTNHVGGEYVTQNHLHDDGDGQKQRGPGKHPSRVVNECFNPLRQGIEFFQHRVG